MIKLEDLLKKQNRIRIIVKKEEYVEFLKWAKTNECCWVSGKTIDPEKDSYIDGVIAITNELLIHHPIGWIANMAWSRKPAYRFVDIKQDVISKINNKK